MSELSRRNLLMGTAIAAGAGAFGLPRTRAAAAPDPGEVGQVRWLEGGVPAATPGVTWGMPWPRGRFPADQPFDVSTADGVRVPAQTWVTGYWPDGSVKWTAHALGPEAATAPRYRVEPGAPLAPTTPVTVSTRRDTIDVDTGVIRVRLNRRGSVLVRSIARGEQVVARDGELVCLRADSADDAAPHVRRESFVSVVHAVAVEQSGPVRAVVRVEGRHRSERGRQEWLPFVVRLYFYAGGDADRTFLVIDPIRKIRTEPYTPDPHALDIGFGTDWGALAAAWLTEWERGGAPVARQRLESTMRTIGAQTNGFVQGSALYDLDTGEFAVADPPRVSVSHLSAVFGLVEMCSELVGLLDVPEFDREWLRYCRFYNATAAEQTAEFGASFGNLNLRQAHARLTAYAAARTGDPALAARAWREFEAGHAGYGPTVSWRSTRVEPPLMLSPVDETDFVSTNASAQYGLAAIQCLALVGDHLPPGQLR